MRTSKKHNHRTMDKKKIENHPKRFEQCKRRVSNTKKYIEDRLEEECSKENISVDEVIFLFTYREAKS